MAIYNNNRQYNKFLRNLGIKGTPWALEGLHIPNLGQHLTEWRNVNFILLFFKKNLTRAPRSVSGPKSQAVSCGRGKNWGMNRL